MTTASLCHRNNYFCCCHTLLSQQYIRNKLSHLPSQQELLHSRFQCRHYNYFSLLSHSAVTTSRSGELRTQKLRSHLIIHSLKVLSLKPGVGLYIAMHATLTARDFFLAHFYPSGQFTCIFSKTSPDFSLCWLWLTHGSCVGPQNKIGHPAGCRLPC